MKPKNRRAGFDLMSDEDRRKISAVGGRIAHIRGKANRFTSESGAVAGRKGGAEKARRERERKKLGRELEHAEE